MLTRFLGGTAACLGAAGLLHAQTPVAPPAVFGTPPAGRSTRRRRAPGPDSAGQAATESRDPRPGRPEKRFRPNRRPPPPRPSRSAGQPAADGPWSPRPTANC